jgi:hypothetical protein
LAKELGTPTSSAFLSIPMTRSGENQAEKFAGVS